MKALSLIGLMPGTLQLCRALTDRQLSDDLLEQGLRNALALLGAEHHSRNAVRVSITGLGLVAQAS